MRRKAREILDKITHFLQKRSLQFTISLTFTAVSVIGMLIVGLSLSMRYINLSEKMIAEDNTHMVNQVNLNLDTYLRNMMRISDSMYYRVIKNADLSTDNISNDMSLLYETNHDLLISIGVFSNSGKVIAAEPLAQLKPSSGVTDQSWFTNASQKIENSHFSTPHVQNLFADPDNKYHWVVSLSRAVELTNAGSITHGVLLVDMNFSGIEQICKNVDMGESGYIYLTNGDGELIYHPRQQLIYSNLMQENNAAAAHYDDSSHSETFQGQKRMVTVKTVGYTGWKIIAVTPMQDITSNYQQIRIFAGFFVFFSIFLMVFLNMFLSSRIANPIKELEHSVRDLDKGNLNSVDISVSGSYEVQHLGKTIRSMVDQLHKLMDDIVAEQESKRKSELDALQSQINPHFLYNTLDSIIWMVENERYDGAVTMVTALARLFRISLSKGKNIISVADELEHVRNYLTIQKMRYKNKFVYEIDAEPETLHYATIKLIVQPLVENAIYHGMEFMGGDGEIRIHAYQKENSLYIDIIDNGLGMPQEQADALLTETRVRGKGSGIGLKNVQERIQLYFGSDYGLAIYSEPDEGTTARIHLPLKTLEELDKGGDGK
ncbi:cache domain-containing sensor histidine kinase [Caproiciproducens galactitolivorans]|uniref:histidine kinase n=1 Tax=Caproiciproducens galactitolivorans TaxID=642589 RepID=A0ABT4BRU4_9FIRM|nr:sensor histidine kinase [Caproiciproducens galactitolivorans]MCY1713615.1 sensor histidine kinase [Caproiciproducens galactitolivorans]